MSFNTTLQSNNTDLQTILDMVNTLPDAGGVELPELSNPGTAENLLEGTQLIDGDGNVVEGAMPNIGTVTARIEMPNVSYSIAEGYHDGKGKVTIAYASKRFTPTKETQGYNHEDGSKDFLYQVVVEAIPDAYQDVTAVTATAEDVAAGKVFVDALGAVVTGTAEVGGGSSGDAADYSDNEDAIISRTIGTYYNDRVTKVGDYAFGGCSRLTTASFPTAKTIGSYAFADCDNLTTASFPVATTIGGHAFNGCYSLTTASFPMAKTIGFYAFNGCNNLTTASFPVATTISSYAFNGCGKLTTANFPAATMISSYAFNNCIGLTTVSFPVATTIGDYAFSYCSSLTTANFPAAKTIGGRAFNRCSRLTTVSFPVATTIGSYAFQVCQTLSSVILAGSSICKLQHSNAFSSTPYAGYSAYFSGTPYIYVPSSLMASYKASTNWAYFSSYFSAIEDMT